MASNDNTRGGSHDQHVKAGEQSHKNDDHSKSAGASSRGGSHEQHVKAGEQSHKNDTGSSGSSGSRGHKND